MRMIAHAPLAGAPSIIQNVKAIARAHGRTGAMITSGVSFVLATVVAIFLVAAYARPAAKAEFLARLAADHAAACDRLGQGAGTSEHAASMSELMRLNACPNQGF
jgi:hypothetical protein